MARKNRKRGYSGKSKTETQEKMARTVDTLADYEDYREKIAVWMRRDLQNGMSAKDIRKKYSAMVQARMTSIALTESDPGKAMAAGKDHLDREEGKAKETKELSHRLSDLPQEELASVLHSSLTELRELEIDEEDEDEQEASN